MFDLLLVFCVVPWLLAGCTGRVLRTPPPPPTAAKPPYVKPSYPKPAYPKPPEVVMPAPPRWHRLQSGIYTAPEGRLFLGIGRADGAQNLTLLRATADNRSRQALAGVLENYVGELTQSEALDAEPGWQALSMEERRQVVGQVVQNALRRAVVTDHWRDAKQARLFALCRLGLPQFRQALADVMLPDERVRAILAKQAEKVHTRLARQY